MEKEGNIKAGEEGRNNQRIKENWNHQSTDEIKGIEKKHYIKIKGKIEDRFQKRK